VTYQDIREEARSVASKLEKRRIRKVLRSSGWSVQAAAYVLDVSPSTLYRAVERHPDLRLELSEKSPPPGRSPTAV